ncbi:hypothetical protein [Rhizobium sp.]
MSDPQPFICRLLDSLSDEEGGILSTLAMCGGTLLPRVEFTTADRWEAHMDYSNMMSVAFLSAAMAFCLGLVILTI